MDESVVGELQPPRSLLGPGGGRDLTTRQREVVAQLESIFLEQGFSAPSIQDLAESVSCSRRTLYDIAPSKSELVLVVLDRFLRRVGRNAVQSIDPSTSRAEQIVAYYRSGGLELHRPNTEFGRDITKDPAARRLLDEHFSYATKVLAQLIQLGIDEGEFRDVNANAVAAALAGGGLYLNDPRVQDDLGVNNPAIVVNDVVDVFVRGLAVEGV